MAVAAIKEDTLPPAMFGEPKHTIPVADMRRIAAGQVATAASRILWSEGYPQCFAHHGFHFHAVEYDECIPFSGADSPVSEISNTLHHGSTAVSRFFSDPSGGVVSDIRSAGFVAEEMFKFFGARYASSDMTRKLAVFVRSARDDVWKHGAVTEATTALLPTTRSATALVEPGGVVERGLEALLRPDAPKSARELEEYTRAVLNPAPKSRESIVRDAMRSFLWDRRSSPRDYTEMKEAFTRAVAFFVEHSPTALDNGELWAFRVADCVYQFSQRSIT